MGRRGWFMTRVRLLPLTLVLCGLALARPGSPPPAMADAASTSDLSQRIDHIIVVVEENHTFDSYFGTYPGANGWSRADSYPRDPTTGTPMKPVPYSESIRDWVVASAKEGKELLSNARPAAEEAYNGGRMDGFVGAQLRRGNDGQITMVYYSKEDARGLWSVADRSVLFDNYFSSALGDSLPNMLHLLAGTSNGIEVGTKKTLAQIADGVPTVFDQLQAAGISWKYYIGGLESLDRERIAGGDYLRSDEPTPSQMYWAPILSMKRFWEDPQLNAGLATQDQFFLDAAEGRLPAVSFVLPSPTDHPLSIPTAPQQRLLSLVNAMGKSPQWGRSAMFIVWDEWGGFYDHVPPPQVDEMGLGFRVPALLVSPWAKRGYISHDQYDHTSVLNFIAQRFNLPPLSPREAASNSFETAFQFDAPPREAPAFGLASIPDAPVGTPSQNRLTLMAYLEIFAVVAAVIGFLVWAPHIANRKERPDDRQDARPG